MLKKLVKHELQLRSKSQISLMLGLIFISVFIRVLSFFKGDISTTSYFVFSFLVTICPTLYLFFIVYSFSSNISRFKVSFFSDEGYLMHTLPVKPETHIISKLISGLICYIAYLIVIFISILIAFANSDDIEFIFEIIEGLSSIIKQYPLESILVIIQTLFIYVLITLLGYISTSIFAMKGRLLSSLFSFIVFFTGSWGMGFIYKLFIEWEFSTIAVIICNIIICSIISYLEYLVLVYFFKNKLNLQ